MPTQEYFWVNFGIGRHGNRGAGIGDSNFTGVTHGLIP